MQAGNDLLIPAGVTGGPVDLEAARCGVISLETESLLVLQRNQFVEKATMIATFPAAKC